MRAEQGAGAGWGGDCFPGAWGTLSALPEPSPSPSSVAADFVLSVGGCQVYSSARILEDTKSQRRSWEPSCWADGARDEDGGDPPARLPACGFHSCFCQKTCISVSLIVYSLR